MPIYVYECDNKHRFEKWQSMKDESLKECPECSASVRRILQPAGIIFKGSGWYITDSRKTDSSSSGESKEGKGKSEAKSEGGEAKSEGPSEAKKESSAESKSDSKTESKSASASSSSSESKSGSTAS